LQGSVVTQAMLGGLSI